MFIEHVNLTVANLERSVAFYEDLFGWTTRWRGHSTTSGRPAAHVGDDRCYVAFFEAEAGPSGSDRHAIDYKRVGFNHFGVVVDDLDTMKRRLAERGIEHGDEQDYEPGRRVYLIDPDGYEVEVVQYQIAAV